MRVAPTITDNTAAAPTYHHSEPCRNATVLLPPRGLLGSTADTRAAAAETSTVAPRMTPSLPTPPPSPRRIRIAHWAPRMNSDTIMSANATQVT